MQSWSLYPVSKVGMVYIHPADFGWSNLGNWASLHDKLQKDEFIMAAIGNIYVYECKNYVVYVEDTNKVVFQGLDGYIASEKNGYILICQRSEEQRIKEYKGYDR